MLDICTQTACHQSVLNKGKGSSRFWTKRQLVSQAGKHFWTDFLYMKTKMWQFATLSCRWGAVFSQPVNFPHVWSLMKGEHYITTGEGPQQTSCNSTKCTVVSNHTPQCSQQFSAEFSSISNKIWNINVIWTDRNDKLKIEISNKIVVKNEVDIKVYHKSVGATTDQEVGLF